LVLCALLPACRVRAEQAAWQRAAGALSSTAIRAHVDFLTDDLLEGRRAGSRGEALAARYVASQLESYGLPVVMRRVPLAVARMQSAQLTATRGNVQVELKYGDDFLLLAAPRGDALEVADPPFERPGLEPWLRMGPAGAAAALVPEGPLRVAISPAAVSQVNGARLLLKATLDHSEVSASDVVVTVPGRDPCAREVAAHHDSFGPGYPGALDGAVHVGILLEVARGLALARTKPRCTLTVISSGRGEWGGPHGVPPTGWQMDFDRRHSKRDRIARDFDWEAFKRRAQQILESLG